ncbi:FkbM family methyltransferase [Patescibacteria group bacterium]|nr:FkbM family methyltransferase [Patescibacteria group bacterium]
MTTITLAQLLKDNTFDALKMDIEGGEYPLLTYMIEQDIFPFTKGFIELHFTPEEHKTQYALFLKFASFLSTK